MSPSRPPKKVEIDPYDISKHPSCLNLSTSSAVFAGISSAIAFASSHSTAAISGTSADASRNSTNASKVRPPSVASLPSSLTYGSSYRATLASAGAAPPKSERLPRPQRPPLRA